MKQPKEFNFLVEALKSLPTIGEKTANRLAVFLLEQDDHYQKEFIKRLDQAFDNLHSCKWCNSFTNNEICEICHSTNLNRTLCIVMSYEDLQKISETRNYFGYYHLLKLSPQSQKVDLSKINLEQILKQIEALNIQEIIIATPFSVMGELIATYLSQHLNKYVDNNVYRLGFGIPLNANIDYIDNETIKESFINKKKIS